MLPLTRRLDCGRLGVHLERRRSSSVCRQPESAGRVQDGQLLQQEVRRVHRHRDLQLPQGRPGLRQGALLLHRHHLRPLLHDRGRLLVLLLAGLQGGAGEGGAGRDHPPGHVHHHGQYTAVPASGCLHQG